MSSPHQTISSPHQTMILAHHAGLSDVAGPLVEAAHVPYCTATLLKLANRLDSALAVQTLIYRPLGGQAEIRNSGSRSEVALAI